MTEPWRFVFFLDRVTFSEADELVMTLVNVNQLESSSKKRGNRGEHRQSNYTGTGLSPQGAKIGQPK